MTWTEPSVSTAKVRWRLLEHTGLSRMSELVSRAEGGAHRRARATGHGGGTASNQASGAWRSLLSAQPEDPGVRQKQIFPPIKNKFKKEMLEGEV